MKAIRSWLLGIIEFRSSVTSSRLDYRWYDRGRELAHRVTLRRWDE